MTSNHQIVVDAFATWSAGDGHVSAIFHPKMRWEIVGRSAASGEYGSAQQFIDEVLRPFGARFGAESPFRPVRIRGVYADDDESTVVVIWDGEGTTIADTIYRNTYAWILTLDGGKVIKGTAFYDSIAFNELWESVQPSQDG